MTLKGLCLFHNTIPKMTSFTANQTWLDFIFRIRPPNLSNCSSTFRRKLSVMVFTFSIMAARVFWTTFAIYRYFVCFEKPKINSWINTRDSLDLGVTKFDFWLGMLILWFVIWLIFISYWVSCFQMMLKGCATW